MEKQPTGTWDTDSTSLGLEIGQVPLREGQFTEEFSQEWLLSSERVTVIPAASALLLACIHRTHFYEAPAMERYHLLYQGSHLAHLSWEQTDTSGNRRKSAPRRETSTEGKYRTIVVLGRSVTAGLWNKVPALRAT